MNAIVLEDRLVSADLFPFTLTRSVSDIRVGILTIREKWEKLFDIRVEEEGSTLVPALPANLIPTQELANAIREGKWPSVSHPGGYDVKKIQYPWHIFQLNDDQIKADFEGITKKRISQPISGTNRLVMPEKIFVEEGAKLEYALLNASKGPIYIGKNAEIMEGVSIHGPFAMGESAILKMGTRVYGATSIGPFCVVGGEIKNSVIFGYSNKAHEGYLGDAVIGEWCNLGAGTSSSNVKNSGGEIKIWNDVKKEFVAAGNRCGLLMGDYSRSAIQTSFNTGTVTGVCCNIYGLGLTPAYLHSFSRGYSPPLKYDFGQALREISNWKTLKNQVLTEVEIRTLKHIFDQS